MQDVRQRFENLDILRALALLWVIVGHSLLLAGFFDGTNGALMVFDPVYGVSLFFAVSGALVAGSLVSETGAVRRWLPSVLKRSARLAVPHFVALIFYTLLISANTVTVPFVKPVADIPGALASISLLFGAWPTSGEVNLGVPGNWSISIEFIAALVLMPLLVRGLRLERHAFRALVALTLITCALSPLLRSLNTGLYFWAPLHASSFLAGYWAILRSRVDKPMSPKERLALVLILLAMVSMMSISHTPQPATAGFLAGFVVLAAIRSKRPLLGNAVGRSAVWLGSRSYGGYLGHFVGLSLVTLFLPPALRVGILGATPYMVGALGTAIVLAFPFSRWVEGPSIALGRRLAALFD